MSFLPGLWLMRGAAMVHQDTMFASASASTLDELRARLKGGEPWPAVRDWWYASRVPVDDATNQHVKDHWFNANDQGWWPQRPIAEIYGEAIYQIVTRMLHDENGDPRSAPITNVKSYWIAAGNLDFRVAISLPDQQLTVMYLTPPLVGSEHRGRYLSDAEPSPGDPGYSATSDAYGEQLTLSGPIKSADTESSDPTTRFISGRVVKIAIGGQPPVYRTLRNVSKGATSLTLNRAAFPGQSVTCWALGTGSNGSYGETNAFQGTSNVWMINDQDHASDVNSDPVNDSCGLPGIVVRRARTTHAGGPPLA